MADIAERATHLLMARVGRHARLIITWVDGPGWTAGWEHDRHRYRVQGATATDALGSLIERLSAMPSLSVT